MVDGVTCTTDRSMVRMSQNLGDRTQSPGSTSRGSGAADANENRFQRGLSLGMLSDGSWILE